MPATTIPASTRPTAVAALRAIARALSSAWDLDSTLDLIARKTTEVMLVDSCTLYLLDPDRRTLRLGATTGLARRALGRATLRVGEGMTGRAVEINAPVFAIRAQDHPYFKWVDEAEESAFESLLAVPLVIEEEAIGAMNVQTLQPHDFTADDVEVLSLVGDLAAGALAKAQLYDRQTRQLEELRTLGRVSEAVTSPQYLDDMLDIVTKMAAQAMDAAECSIFLIDETGARLELRSAEQRGRPNQRRATLRVGEGVTGAVAASGQPATILDVQHDPRYLQPERAREAGLVSLLSVPLIVRERVIGVLNCYTGQQRAFNPEQTALLVTLANQTALAIENAQLVTNAAVVREMHHRIKNNLQTVAMLMQLQLGEAAEQRTRDILQTSIQRVRSIAAVHDVLSERGFRLVDVKDVLQRITRTTGAALTAPHQSIQIDITGETLPLPARAATALTLVVHELVNNALKHAFRDRGAGTVEVSLGRAPDEIVVVVRDDGSGFADRQSRGLGLEIVEMLVRDDLRGRLRFNHRGQGTEVSIRIPRTVEHE